MMPYRRNDDSGEFLPIDGEVRHATQKAVLVVIDGEDDRWIPKSLCEGGDDLAVGDTDIRVQRWGAEQEGLA